MISRIVRFNRSCASWLERKLPFVFGSDSYKLELERRIHQDINTRNVGTILEVGGIDRPLLKRTSLYQYIGLDIESRPDCFAVYDRFIVQSIEQPVDVVADMIISITLMEHIPDNEAALHSMYLALKPGGIMHHYIPSKWHPYSIALRLVGPRMQKRLIKVLRPAAADVTGYPAFFDACDPAAMTGLMRRRGFVDIDLKAYYRGSDYFAFFLPAFVVVTLFENVCSMLNIRFFASGFVVSARRP